MRADKPVSVQLTTCRRQLTTRTASPASTRTQGPAAPPEPAQTLLAQMDNVD